jgi:hypothetical protein
MQQPAEAPPSRQPNPGRLPRRPRRPPRDRDCARTERPGGTAFSELRHASQELAAPARPAGCVSMTHSSGTRSTREWWPPGGGGPGRGWVRVLDANPPPLPGPCAGTVRRRRRRRERGLHLVSAREFRAHAFAEGSTKDVTDRCLPSRQRVRKGAFVRRECEREIEQSG